MSVRRAAGGYFLIQGVTVLCWWLLLWVVPSTRGWFRMGSGADPTLMAFCLPDLILFGAGSLAAGGLCLRGSDLAPAALWGVSGAVSYAALYCLDYAWQADAGWWGVTLMLPAMLLSVASTAAVSPWSVRLFRSARPAGAAWNLTKTALQIVAFWGYFLFFVPSLLVRLEGKVGVPDFTFPGQHILADALFLGLSALGLWSGYVMTVQGRGTPLPIDSPTRLVAGGPYAYVRNPMAIAGLGQGLMVGLWWGAPFVLVYGLLGVWIWQVLTRPLEEADIRRQFGPAYDDYCRHVRCWWPRRAAYQAKDAPLEADESLV
jgi:protein-S-isoprenylcysteine O-methyltransferase Ste14